MQSISREGGNLEIYSKIYSEFTFYRLGGTCFLEPQITLIALIFKKLQILQITQKL